MLPNSHTPVRLLLLCLIGCGWSAPGRAQTNPFAAHVRPTPPRSPAEEQSSFRLPPGFRITCFACEPEIHKPLNMAFDLRGRLWLTETVEYPYPAPADRPGRDRVVILEDTDGDGVSDRTTIFAEGLNIPIGIQPYGRGAIVFTIPNIVYLEDTDGDGRADRRTKILGPFDYSRDTHGLNNSFRRSFDGWIYACHGFANQSRVGGKDGHTVTLVSGNVYRFRPDGSRIEIVSIGQVNPFGMTVDPWGDLFTADCHSKPLTHIIPGACYPSFGRPHNGLGFAPELMSHSHGSTAIAGVARVELRRADSPYQGTLVSGNVMTSRINHNRITYHGATATAHELPDFVTTSDPWFRPVDLRFGPDGALYVADFYNRIIGHYEVPLDHPGRDRFRGRIWRITFPVGSDSHTQQARPAVPTPQSPSLESLLALTDHPQTEVRLLALHELVDRHGAEVLEPLRRRWSTATSRQRVCFVWAELRLGAKEPPSLLPRALHDADPLVRYHAWKVVRERSAPPPDFETLFSAALLEDAPRVKKAAALAGVRHPLPALAPVLTRALQQTDARDTELRYVLRMSLRAAMSTAGAFQWVTQHRQQCAADWRERIADVAMAIPTPEAAAFLYQWLREHESASTPQQWRHVMRWATPELAREIAASQTNQAHGPVQRQAERWIALAEGWWARGDGRRLQELEPWAGTLLNRLLAAQPAKSRPARTALAQQVLRYASDRKLAERIITEIGHRRDQLTPDDQGLLLAAFEALQSPYLAAIAPALFQTETAPALRRVVEATVFDRQNPNSREKILLRVLKESPAGVQLAVARQTAGHAATARLLADAILQNQLPDLLLRDGKIQQRLAAQLPADLVEPLRRRLEAVESVDFDRQNKLIASLARRYRTRPGDANRGVALFEKHCSICHQIGNRGAVIAPQLDGIGQRGLARIVEDIVAPNRNVDPQFRTVLLKLRDGRVVSGLSRRKTDTVWVLADQQGKEFSIARDDVEAVRSTPTSLMPTGLDQTLGDEALGHLLAYLLEQVQPEPNLTTRAPRETDVQPRGEK